MKTLIKLDLLVYIIFSLAALIVGTLMITGSVDISASSKNIDEALTYVGGFVLIIGITSCIVTFIKIRDTNFKD